MRPSASFAASTRKPGNTALSVRSDARMSTCIDGSAAFTPSRENPKRKRTGPHGWATKRKGEKRALLAVDLQNFRGITRKQVAIECLGFAWGPAAVADGADLNDAHSVIKIGR